MSNFFKLALLVSVALLPFASASALELKDAKARGLVGETLGGYLEAVKPNPGGKVVALVNDINGKRRAKYQQIAKKNGTNLAAVEELAGKKAVGKTDPGNFVKRADGQWKRK